MKHYTFDSRLSPEQVCARLQVRARPMRSGWAYEENQVLTRLLPDGGFYLVKTGGMWQVKPLLPFVGTVTAAEGGCRICGGFCPTKAMRNLLLGMMAVAFAVGLAFTGLSAYALATLSFCVLLWGGLCWFLLTKLAPALNRRQQRETIAFIEENLLRESAARGKENLK